MEQLLALAAVLIFVSVVSSKISDKFAIPVLLIFLAVGMLAGSEGIGGIFFNDTRIAKSIGVIALIFIIFSGGFDTDWKETKPVLWHGVLLSTVGVFITAVITGFFAMYALGFSLLEGMLLGSIVSSTD
ncbi:MAG TPA: cation:proton antiporter, partial [bacterium]|nr:cation:proton antiporter [bacterium]